MNLLVNLGMLKTKVPKKVLRNSMNLILLLHLLINLKKLIEKQELKKEQVKNR